MISDRIYFRTARRAITSVNSDASLKDKLSVIVRGVARSMHAASSIVLLDNTRTKLIHSVSYGLPQYYLKKGLLDIEKSLSEVSLGQTIKITDITKEDNRIQYPEMAVKAGINSILGIPIMLHDKQVGVSGFIQSSRLISAIEISAL